MQRRVLASLAVALLAVAVCAPSGTVASEPGSAFGVMAGVVVDPQGTPQMGAAIALIAGDGRILRSAYSGDNGAFVIERVIPGLYSLRVTLASYLPVLKENVLIRPGIHSFLSINMTSLFTSLDLLRGRRSLRQSDDDWTWVLRSAGADRAVFRYMPFPPSTRNSSSSASRASIPSMPPTVLQFSGGDGRSSSLGSEADFNTSFATANQILDNTSLFLSGNLGFERRTPATAFRGVVRREFGNGSTPEVSITLRQIMLPGAFWANGMTERENQLQTLNLAAGDRFRVTDALRLEYGFLWDSISYLSRLNSFSPYGRLVYEPDDRTSVRLVYSAGGPRTRLAGGGALYEMASDLALFPRISVRDNTPVMQRGQHLEASYTRKFDNKTRATAGVFQDQVNNLAVTVAGHDQPLPSIDFFPDIFTQNYSFRGGDFHTTGFRAGVQHDFGDRLEGTLAYSYSGVLTPERNALYTNNADELRGILKMQERHALTAKIGAEIPVTHTRVFAAYKWVLGVSVTPGDLYDESLAQADPNLNIVVRQPLPSSIVLPGRIEAVADFRNLLAQGYVPIITADGRRMLLVQNLRSFRGGLAFHF